MMSFLMCHKESEMGQRDSVIVLEGVSPLIQEGFITSYVGLVVESFKV